ncbi:MAG: S9 family peptidase [Spirochaetota bacterium]|nr:S9 family peptidase [Spirochaetota bacterium]
MRLFSTALLWFMMAGIISCETGNSGNKNSLLDHDIDEFLKIPYSGSFKEGLNGFRIYNTWSTKSGGVVQVYEWHPDRSKHRQVSRFKEGVDRRTMSPSGKYLVVGIDKGGNEDTGLWLYERDKDKWRKILSKKNTRYSGVDWHRTKEGFFYSSNEANPKHFDIYYYDIQKGQSEKVFGGKGIYYVSDSTKDGELLIVKRMISNEENRPFLYLRKTKSMRPILWKKGKKSKYRSMFFSDNEKEIYYTSNEFSEYMGLTSYHIESGRIKQIHPELTRKWSIEGIASDRSRTFYTLVLNEGGLNKIYVTGPANNWKIKLFQPLGEGMYGISQITKDLIYFTYQSARATQDSYSVPRNFEGYKPVKLTNSDTQGIPLERFNTPKLIHYQSFDGLMIPAFLYLPPDYKAKTRIPFIIHAHGGPESQFKPYFNRHFQYLNSRGYGVIAPNVRGSSGYGKGYMALDNYKKRNDSVKDYYHAAKWLIDNDYSKKGLLGVKGSSYGGYMVMALITGYPDLFSAAINKVGIVNFVSFLKKTKSYRRAIREKEYGPLTDIAFLKSISPIHTIDRVKTPLFVVHGENDPRVPVGEARQVISALKKSGGTVESLIFPDEGHSAAKLENRLIYYRKMVKWFDQHLKKKN